jgi:multiple sugar transport system substrate-binding protein
MSKRVWTGLLAGAAMSLASGAAAAQELTIFWAEWDPSNYLQELVNEYTAETGVTVTVETTPWSDFQTKAFTEFNARGDAYDMVVGDSQWLGAGSTGGHYVDLTDFFAEHGVAELMAPATVASYAEYPKDSKKYWAVPVEGDATGWAYRKDWFEDPAEKEAFQAKYGYELDVPQTWAQMRDIAEFFYRPDEQRYGIALYTDNSYDALVMGYENALFSFGGDLGDYTTYQVDGMINSPEAVAALEAYRELYQFTPPNWGKAFFLEDNQAITEGLAAMSMNYFAFFPALANPATNPNADVTGFFANPAGPDGKQHAALGGQGVSIVTYSQNQEEAFKFL